MGPLAKRHLNGFSLAGGWWPNIECWLGSFEALHGDLDQYCLVALYFCDFSGKGVRTPCPPLDPPMIVVSSHLTQRMVFWYYKRKCWHKNRNVFYTFKIIYQNRSIGEWTDKVVT